MTYQFNSRIRRLLHEMPNFIKNPKPKRGTSKFVDRDTGRGILEYENGELDGLNIAGFYDKFIPFIHEKTTYIWFFMDESVLAGCTDGKYCPPMFTPHMGMHDTFSGRSPISDLWKIRKHSNIEDKIKDKNIVGALQAIRDSDNALVIDMISIRRGYQKSGISTRLVSFLKRKFPSDTIRITPTTSAGDNLALSLQKRGLISGYIEKGRPRDGGGFWVNPDTEPPEGFKVYKDRKTGNPYIIKSTISLSN